MTYARPLFLLCCGLLLGGLALVRTRLGRRLAWCGLLGLLPRLLASRRLDLRPRPLEARYPARPPQRPAGVQAMVVLGSSTEPPQYERPYALPHYGAFKRCEHAVWLYRRWGPLPVLAYEGGGRPTVARW